MTSLSVANNATFLSSQPSTFDLHISDPASLLNEVARRYSSTERILMEYIDNALDDAEKLYQTSGEAYPYEIKIEVVINSRNRYVLIRDNCRGMKRDVLERIVSHVGESQKKGITWVNGQFGFGVHAFRAGAEAIEVRTKSAQSGMFKMRLQRQQHKDIQRPWAVNGIFPTSQGTGTEVIVGPFVDEWFDGVNAESIKREIETHFERLLARPNLSITVQEANQLPLRCQSFDYSQLNGESFHRVIDLEFGGKLYPIEFHLKVSDVEVPGQTARFFARGRRINEIKEIKSFLNKSKHRTSVWGHPHLLGYIEVGHLVRPVITRDDFIRGKERIALYEAILTMEDEIRDAVNRVNEAHRDNSLNRLEDALRDVLEGLSREDRLSLRAELSTGTQQGKLNHGGGSAEGMEGGPITEESIMKTGRARGGTGNLDGTNPKEDGTQTGQANEGQQVLDDPLSMQGAERKRSGFDIRFYNLPADLNGHLSRSKLVDGTIIINKAHPDFQDRVTTSRQGLPRFNDRLGAYLAQTVSIHYKDQLYQRYGRQPERRDQMFEEQVAFSCRLESALRPCLSVLQQELTGNVENEEMGGAL
jgi:hypothetical protein